MYTDDYRSFTAVSAVMYTIEILVKRFTIRFKRLFVNSLIMWRYAGIVITIIIYQKVYIKIYVSYIG